jgi:predicted secreted protein
MHKKHLLCATTLHCFIFNLLVTVMLKKTIQQSVFFIGSTSEYLAMNTYCRIVTALLLCTAAPSWAAETPTQLELSASAQREVDNDQLNATLYLEERQLQPAVLADSLNRKSAAALAIARAYPNVETRNSAYSSWPTYAKNGQIQGWQGRVEIQLKSTDFVQSAELVARLQKTMLLQGLDFSVSDAARKRTEQLMLPEAIKQLQDTAQIAARALGKHQVLVRALNIGNDGGAPRLMMMNARAKQSRPEADEVATPDWQAGRSQLRIQVSGKLEIN